MTAFFVLSPLLFKCLGHQFVIDYGIGSHLAPPRLMYMFYCLFVGGKSDHSSVREGAGKYPEGSGGNGVR
jgi:hypothetical protein